MFEILFIIAVSIYFIQVIVISIGAQKSYPKLKESELPKATVIVAARNEEENILNCLISLNKLKYPENKLEIIIVDDYSTDKTESIILNYIKDKPIFKLIKPENDFGTTKGKSRAIANAIEIAKGDIILTTDADCVVSPTWAKTTASYYLEDVGMVCGFTNQNYVNAFQGMQDVDFIYLLTVGAGTINLGKPISAIGNNMSYRKSVYKEVGGYESLPFSVTEDSQLLLSISKLKKYKIIYPLDKESLVTSEPCKDFKTLFQQKKRWGVGGMDVSFYGFIVIGTAFIVTLLSLLIPFFYSIDVLYMLAFKLFTDFFMIFNIYKKLDLKFNFINFVAFEIYSNIYFLTTSVSILISRKVYWKGREY